jgi:sarcosine oxidase subunit delta
MQLFECPFCGPRAETEFHFGGEAGNLRPEAADATPVSAEAWSAYLYLDDNPRGAAREIWVHLTCAEFFVMERDTVTHAVIASIALGGERP